MQVGIGHLCGLRNGFWRGFIGLFVLRQRLQFLVGLVSQLGQQLRVRGVVELGGKIPARRDRSINSLQVMFSSSAVCFASSAVSGDFKSISW